MLQVTLMDWGNCIVRSIDRSTDGNITGISGDLHLEGDFKKTKLKLTWLADVPDVVPLRLVELGDLITKPKVVFFLSTSLFSLLSGIFKFMMFLLDYLSTLAFCRQS
jgi:hypothetical protein